jgi:hypothetical protein
MVCGIQIWKTRLSGSRYKKIAVDIYKGRCVIEIQFAKETTEF